MSDQEPCKKQRATQKQVALYGRNKRQLWHDYAPVRERVNYLCSYAFSGDHHEMAHAIGMCYRQLYRVLIGHSQLSISMAAQLVSQLGVRAEWLLCGSGPVFACGDEPACAGRLTRIQSIYRAADPLEQLARGNYFLPHPQLDANILTAPAVEQFEAAASNLFSARAQQKPVWFFLDDAHFTPAATEAWAQFFHKRYGTVLSVTLPAVCADMANAGCAGVDINYLALHAAAINAGYGETLCSRGFVDAKNRDCSVLLAAHSANVPVLAHVELGVTPNHVQPTTAAPEFGAALGAAAYIDFLVLSAQLAGFFSEPGGVVVITGDHQRAVNLVATQRHCARDVAVKKFACILFGDEKISITQTLTQLGGSVTYLPEPTAATVTRLFHFCNNAYAGTL